MTMAPMPYRWTGEGWEPLPHVRRQADREFVIGEVRRLVDHVEESEVSRNHQFAFLREAWLNLSDELKAEYPSPDFLRKRGLIATGWCTVQDYVCGSKAEAERWAMNLRRELDPYVLIVVSQSVVRVFKARSQRRGAMTKADFQASKTALIEWAADLLGVLPEELSRARAA